MLRREDLPALFAGIAAAGYTIVGPTVREGAIVYDEIRGVDDLPSGWTDHQEPGRYRLERRNDQALFGFAVGPQSWKKYLQVPQRRLWRARREKRGFEILEEAETEPPRLALIGVRSCELHAIAVQDRVLIGGAAVDGDYQARRGNLLIVAVQCGTAGGTCFCASMQTGPRAREGFDLSLTEILDSGRHEFVVEIGTEQGAAVMRSVFSRPADAEDERRATEITERATRSMGRSLDTTAIRELLYASLEAPRWDEVAGRCLGCANCTMVCPTCFCTTVEDVTDLEGNGAERVQRWDSCFTVDHSYIHGGSVRSSIRARYRQWLTHKLASWIDQFGTSGCVGCGRCITWCPVGIDLTEEVAALRAAAGERTP